MWAGIQDVSSAALLNIKDSSSQPMGPTSRSATISHQNVVS